MCLINYHKKAYSIIEMTIVLAVIAMILPLILDILKYKLETNKHYLTEEKLEYIAKAIDAFVMQNERIPCPAETKDYDPNMPSAGFESITGSICSTSISTSNSLQLIVGGIPTKSLNIDDSYALDAFGRRFTYAIVPGCSYSSSENPTYGFGITSATGCASSSDYSLKIRAFSDINSISDSYITENAIYVIISHGESGHGAFRNYYTAASNSSDARILTTPSEILAESEMIIYESDLKIENSHATNSAISAFDSYFTQKQKMNQTKGSSTIMGEVSDVSKGYFDDLVFFKTKSMQLADAGLYDQTSDICSFNSNPSSLSTTYCNGNNATCIAKLLELSEYISNKCK